jgi:hypothetical protein
MGYRFWRKQPLVAAHIAHGLGNQMFQYATARRLALINRAELLLLLGKRFAPPAYRPFGLPNFNIAGKIRADATVLPVVREQDLGDFFHGIEVMGETAADEPLFMPELLNWHGSIALAGFWQNERYFADIGDIIRRDFTLKAPLQGRNREVLARMQHGPSVFLHVRRGDYLRPDMAPFYGVCPAAYYQRGLAFLRTRETAALTVFVFSDDPGWVREHQIGGATAEIIDWNGESPWCDLALMRACRHAVIANSSFSWWGAWLGDMPGRTVIAPRVWYQGLPAYQEIVPARWLRL